MGAKGPVLLVIRDGWGRNPHPEHDAFNAVKLARTPGSVRLPPPAIGQHTREVLERFGFAEGEVSALLAQGVVK